MSESAQMAGEIKAGAFLWNPDNIRFTSAEFLMDTGSNSIVLNRRLISEMGLREIGTTVISSEVGTAERKLYLVGVSLEEEGLGTIFEAVEGDENIMSVIALQAFDMILDPANQTLTRRSDFTAGNLVDTAVNSAAAAVGYTVGAAIAGIVLARRQNAAAPLVAGDDDEEENMGDADHSSQLNTAPVSRRLEAAPDQVFLDTLDRILRSDAQHIQV